MGGICANQVICSRGGQGLEIAADIARGQTHSAEATDGQVGKVLAHAFAVLNTSDNGVDMVVNPGTYSKSL